MLLGHVALSAPLLIGYLPPISVPSTDWCNLFVTAAPVGDFSVYANAFVNGTLRISFEPDQRSRSHLTVRIATDDGGSRKKLK